jgi:hypothetical protein
MADEILTERTLSSYFAATPEELARIDRAPSMTADAAVWREFANAVLWQVIQAYQDGEVTLKRAIHLVRSCSVKCTWKDRLALMALAAQQTDAHPPQASRKKVQNPLWVRRSAAQLVEVCRQERPLEAFAPNDMSGWTTPILEKAIIWLRALELCANVTPRVLYTWYCEAKKAGAFTPDDAAPI